MYKRQLESVIYVVSGLARLRWGERLEFFAEAAPGDFIYVPPYVPHQEINASEDAQLHCCLLYTSDIGIFAERGGESVAVDASGNVYVANGQIFVYNAAGKQIAEIDVPERPIDIIFGGVDRRTLFVLAHHALFAVEVRSQT